jgi:hypothetical protein
MFFMDCGTGRSNNKNEGLRAAKGAKFESVEESVDLI